MNTMTVEDISQVAKIRWMTQAVESLATQVYLNAANRAVIDQITGTLSGAFQQIAGYGQFRMTRTPATSDPNCAPGWCSDGASCYPCDGAFLFPRLLPSEAPPAPEPEESLSRHGSQPKPAKGANPKK